MTPVEPQVTSAEPAVAAPVEPGVVEITPCFITVPCTPPTDTPPSPQPQPEAPKAEEPAAPPAPSAEEKLLTEIRDLLKEKN